MVDVPFASFKRSGKLYEIYQIKDRFTIFMDGQMTQQDLMPEAIVRWFANGMNESSKKIIHVVMGNDYPAAVFATLATAEAYCVKKRKEGPFNPSGSSRIYWRIHDFNLNDERNAN